MSDLSVGDFVKLTSYGPAKTIMTIETINPDGKLVCSWDNHDGRRTGLFLPQKVTKRLQAAAY